MVDGKNEWREREVDAWEDRTLRLREVLAVDS